MQSYNIKKYTSAALTCSSYVEIFQFSADQRTVRVSVMVANGR